MKRKAVFDLRFLLSITTLIFMLTACADNDIEDPIIDTEDDQLAYVAFNESIKDTWIPKYSVGGVEVVLSDGKRDAHITSIVVSDNDVYASGHALNSQNQLYALYWKNGNAVLLTDSTTNQYALAEDIVVVDGDVYVAGYKSNGHTNVAMYWKNGIGVELGDGKMPSYARSIFVVDNDVYVAGNEMNKLWGGTSGARYWKNGVEVNLQGTYASSIFVLGNTVYVAGSFGTTPSYLKNGVVVPLNETRDMGTSDIFADAENVYVASPGIYWNNDTKKSIRDDNGVEMNVHTLFVLDDQTYVGGSSQKNGIYVARYWKNDEIINLTDGKHHAHVSSIFAVAKP